MISNPGSVRDLVGVRPHPTVVRLDDLEMPDAGWLIDGFLLTAEVENHLRALKNALGREQGCGAFLIGHYGSGKSHFLAYLIASMRAGTWLADAPAIVSISLVNFNADNRLEDIIDNALGVETRGGDRRIAWESGLARFPRGVLLMVDELSEFLRSKPDQRAFSEDVRFLQFLGEWARDRRFWVLAAMQEGIEHTGELEHSIYRKIKDRYPLRFLLTPAHVQSLIADSVLVRKPGYEAAAERLAADLRAAYPAADLDFGLFRAIYPLHPATLTFLEEVRDRFSQARGVVDFAVTRLRGDPVRGIQPFLDQPWGSLLTPDAIVDHFRDLFEIQPEFLALAQQVLPWYQKHLADLFPKPALRTLAERLLKLLVLVHLSPARDALTPEEAAGWLLYSAIRTDPAKNLEIVRRVLETLAREGRYVTAAANRYRLELREDGRAELERRLEREMSGLRGQQALILETLAPLLPADGVNPFLLPRERWQHRRLLWHFHERRYAVWFGEEMPADPPEIAFCVRPPRESGEAATEVHEGYTVVPAPVTVSDDWVELAALVRLGEQPLSPEVIRHIRARIEKRTPPFQQALRAAWAEAVVVTPDGRREAAPRVEPESTLAAWLDQIALRVLRRRFPAFERFAPGHGPLPREAWVRFMRFALAEDIGRYEADEYVKLMREAYLVPMGLMRRQGRDYAAAANLERLELVRLLMPLLEHDPSPQTIHRHLAEPIYGLVPEQINLLLVFLYLQGELDIIKGDRSYRDGFESLPNPLQYERVVLAHGLSAAQLAALERLCEGLDMRAPKQWTVLAQRRMVERVREYGRAHLSALQAAAVQLGEGGRAEPLLGVLREHGDVWRALEHEEDLLQGFERFLQAAGSVKHFLDEVEALRRLPERLPRLAGELKRLQHLLQHPVIAESGDERLAAALESLGEAPDFAHGEALDAWLQRAGALYADYKADYQRRHDQWWLAQDKHPLWRWQAPSVTRSRHIGLAKLSAQLETCREEAAAARCRKLVNLDYQPLCTCGFQNEHAPLADVLARFESLRAQLDAELRAFFQQASVKEKILEWRREGLDIAEQAVSYLNGGNSVPEIRDVELFDRLLAGLEKVETLDLARLAVRFQQRVCTADELSRALAEELLPLQGRRLRVTGGAPAPEVQDELAQWCAEQCLRHAAPLPRNLSPGLLRKIGAALRPEWADPGSVRQIERLGLDEEAQERILGWLIDGHIPLPETPAEAHTLPAVLSRLMRPRMPATAEELACTSEAAYRHHPLLSRAAGRRWLEYLEVLAAAPLPPLPALSAVLQEYTETQWLLLDCAGLPLFGCVRDALEKTLNGWTIARQRFAEVSADTTTDGCYRQLLQHRINHFFDKIEAVDRIIHRRVLRFSELAALAATELQLGLKRVRPRLDPQRPLLVFSDHGFRLAADGARYEHGGPSTLERVVPVFLLEAC